MYTKSKIQQINECILYKNMFLENLNHLMDQYLIEDSIFVPCKDTIKELELRDSDLSSMISDKVSISEILDIKGELGGYKIEYDALMREIDGKLAVHSSEFQQTFDGFKTIVEETYAKKEDIGSSITNVDGYTIMLTKEAIITTCYKDGNIIE